MFPFSSWWPEKGARHKGNTGTISASKQTLPELEVRVTPENKMPLRKRTPHALHTCNILDIHCAGLRLDT
jgi:hypothetical protein